MDAPGHSKNRPTTAPAEHPNQRQYCGSVVEADGILLARESQKAGIGEQEPAAPTVRNRQFIYIGRKREEFTSRGNPVVSVDAKKKEPIGKFKNPGACWAQEPQLVNDHDFYSDAVGRAIPYGIYDTGVNQGFVVVGTSRETPAFAVDAIALCMVEPLWAEDVRRGE
jgi:hypothetical protein